MLQNIKIESLSIEKNRILNQFLFVADNENYTDKEVDLLCGAYGMAFRKQNRSEITEKAKDIQVNF